MFKIKDSRGRESVTLSFVAVSWFAATVKFILAGLTVPVLGVVPDMGVGMYAAAVGVLLTLWLGREYTEKVTRSMSEVDDG